MSDNEDFQEAENFYVARIAELEAERNSHACSQSMWGSWARDRIAELEAEAHEAAACYEAERTPPRGHLLPTECIHGVIIDWGDFGPSDDAEPEGCDYCTPSTYRPDDVVIIDGKQWRVRPSTAVGPTLNAHLVPVEDTR